MSVKPKKKCCLSKPRCTRCPLRMLAEGTLPAGLTVVHRKVVSVDKSHRDPAGPGPKRVGKPGKKKSGNKNKKQKKNTQK